MYQSYTSEPPGERYHDIYVPPSRTPPPPPPPPATYDYAEYNGLYVQPPARPPPPAAAEVYDLPPSGDLDDMYYRRRGGEYPEDLGHLVWRDLIYCMQMFKKIPSKWFIVEEVLLLRGSFILYYLVSLGVLLSGFIGWQSPKNAYKLPRNQSSSNSSVETLLFL